MKNIITLGFILLLTLKSFAQTDGISYQAVIIGPDVLELPGKDSEGNYLPNADVLIKFTIFDSGNEVEFEEIQTASTDEFGRINLVIGAIEHDDFETIEWDGTGKQLKVEIDFKNGDGYADMSREDLTFVPYAYHRNITATGTLIVDDNTTLKRELIVDGPTSLNSTLDVTGGNAAYLTGDLTVDGATNLNSSLDVNNKSVSNLTGALNVGETTGLEDTDAPTVLNGTLNVVGLTTVDDFISTGESAFNNLVANTLEVKELTVLDSVVMLGNSFNDRVAVNGNFTIDSDKQIKISSTVHTDIINYTSTSNQKDQVNPKDSDPGKNIDNYPLLVEGSTQGIAIKVTGSRRNGNNFVSFWDSTNGSTLWGRIEGEVESEFANDADYNYDKSQLAFDQASAIIDVAFATNDFLVALGEVTSSVSSSTACAGFGACVTTPIPSWIVGAAAQMVIAVAQEIVVIAYAVKASDNITDYDNNQITNIGVTYASGAGDYAEYLLREDINENMNYGDIVGVRGGKISKNTEGAEKMLVVSYKPIVLGNTPQPNKESQYEKIAFMGQVPVKVFGKVNVGDYIVCSGHNDGLGKAISKSEIKIEDIKNIVGIAWEPAFDQYGLNKINVAVGLNNNDNNVVIEKLENRVNDQFLEINNLKEQVNEITKVLELLLANVSSPNSDQMVALQNSKTLFSKKKSEKKHQEYEVIETQGHDIIRFEITDEHLESAFELARKKMEAEGIDINNHSFWKSMNESPYFKNKIKENLKLKFDEEIHYHKQINKEN